MCLKNLLHLNVAETSMKIGGDLLNTSNWFELMQVLYPSWTYVCQIKKMNYFMLYFSSHQQKVGFLSLVQYFIFMIYCLINEPSLEAFNCTVFHFHDLLFPWIVIRLLTQFLIIIVHWSDMSPPNILAGGLVASLKPWENMIISRRPFLCKQLFLFPIIKS